MTHRDRFHTQLVSLSHFLSYCFITDSIISDITLQVMKQFKKFLEHFVSFQTCDWIFIGERSIWLWNSVYQWSECEASIVQQDWNFKWETFIPTSTYSVQLLSSICSKVSIIVFQLPTTENIQKITIAQYKSINLIVNCHEHQFILETHKYTDRAMPYESTV